jgi:hypothetical protein
MRDAVIVIAAAFAVVTIVLLMVHGTDVHLQEEAQMAYRGYLMESRQLADAGEDPAAPSRVPLPRGYELTLEGDFVVLVKDGIVVERERYKRLALRSGFDTPTHPPPWTVNITSGGIVWTLVDGCAGGCPGECGGSGVVNGSDYTGNASIPNPCTPLEGTGMVYLRRSTLTSDTIDLSDEDGVVLSFWWKGNFSTTATGTATVSVWDGTAWRQVACMEEPPLDRGCTRAGDGSWYKETINMAGFANTGFRIRFTTPDTSLNTLWVDSVSLKTQWR